MIINTIERVEKIDLSNTENDEAIKEIVFIVLTGYHSII